MTGATARARALTDSMPFRAAAKSGFAMNGVLHIIIGAIAVGVAFGNGGEADQSGALQGLASNPLGLVALWLITVGLWALGAFEVLQIALVRGTDRDAWTDRARSAGRAVAYIAIGVAAFRFAIGSGSDSSKQSQGLSATLMQSPGGVVLVVLLGLVIVGVGVFFAVKGITRKFLKSDLTRPPGGLGRAVELIGTIGYIAQGVAFAVVGVLFVTAAVTADPKKASGLDGALGSLRDLPAGPVVLCAVALGIVLYGVYLFARARYAKL